MTGETSPREAAVGYRRPPAATRFTKGQSGNPRGRPKGKANGLPYESVLGQIVTITENGQTKRVTAAEAFLLKLMKDAFAGDAAAMRDMLSTIEAAKSTRYTTDPNAISQIVISPMRPGSVTSALKHLRMGTKLCAFTERARVLLEPWIVEAALARLGDQPMTVEDQRTVLAATRTPWKVKWPAWWVVEV
ncbi:DUF5681 domain-containing protein [Maricaulis sp.]|uniref:DUF5681 domain-containing protein n=1 Tax=Maricaulis sp. TaxID=1486257 RepID=UPI003A8D60AC